MLKQLDKQCEALRYHGAKLRRSFDESGLFLLEYRHHFIRSSSHIDICCYTHITLIHWIPKSCSVLHCVFIFYLWVSFALGHCSGMLPGFSQQSNNNLYNNIIYYFIIRYNSVQKNKLRKLQRKIDGFRGKYLRSYLMMNDNLVIYNSFGKKLSQS